MNCVHDLCRKKGIARCYCGKHYMVHKRNGDFENVPIKSRKGVRKNTGRTHFKKGIRPWNKGIKGWTSHEQIQAIKRANTGRSAWNKGIKVPQLSGTNNPNWGGGITSEDKLERVRFRKTTQKLVFERDDFICQICFERGGYLQVDHIQSWKDFPELRFYLDNCRTLCMGCHYYITFKRKIPKGIIWGHNLSRRIAS